MHSIAAGAINGFAILGRAVTRSEQFAADTYQTIAFRFQSVSEFIKERDLDFSSS